MYIYIHYVSAERSTILPSHSPWDNPSFWIAGWIRLSAVAGSGSKAGCGVGSLTSNLGVMSVTWR